MGIKCPKCGTDNGITMYYGKVCKKCGYDLIKMYERDKKKLKKKVVKKLASQETVSKIFPYGDVIINKVKKKEVKK